MPFSDPPLVFSDRSECKHL